MKSLMLAGLLFVSTVGPPPAVGASSILIVRNGADVCTGAKLGGNFVLTASHCAPAHGHSVSVGQTLKSLGSGTVISNSETLRLAVICSPVSGTPLALATSSPGGAGTAVTIAAGGAPQASTISDNSGNRIKVAALTGKAPCNGDSGGPAVNSSDQIVGVLEHVKGSCGAADGTYTTVYTTAERNFIQSALKQVGECNAFLKPPPPQ